MKPKHIYLITGLLVMALIVFCFIAPAAAADSIDLHTPIETHPLNLTLHEIRETITEICSDTSLRPDEKLQAQTEVLGMDARLQAWLEAERDEVTGEPIYPENIPIVTPILSFFGLAKETPAEPYTQAEGAAAYSAYLDLYLSSYKPTGSFGGPIE